MDRYYFKSFLDFIKKAGKVASQSPKMLKEYTDKLDAFLEYTQNLNRPPIPLLDEIINTLISNGNYIEAAQILFNEGKVYLNSDNLEKYYATLRKGLVCLFATVFIPELYTELLNTINEVRKTEYYPFFLFLKGYVEHIHMHKYEQALSDYLKIKNILPHLKDELIQIMGITDKSTFDGILSLDMVDVLFKLSLHSREDKEYYLAMADDTLHDLSRKAGGGGRISTFLELSWIQYLIIKGEAKKGWEFLNDFIQRHEKYNKLDGYKHMVLYLKALYFWTLGDYKSTIKNLEDAISEAINSGDEMMTRETIDFALFLLETSGREFSIYSREGEEILNTLLGILFSKDWYLGIDHSTKVAELSLKIAREYSKMTGVNLDEEKIYMAGLLHDIGKLYVPWYVLNKPSRLNELEWLCIKYHPVYGREIMERIGLGEYAKYVEEHHERIDGTGYPYGKKSLPAVSQIIGVSDIFEAATTTNRFYKKPKSRDEIIEELKEMGGSKFDMIIIISLIRALGENIKEHVS